MKNLPKISQSELAARAKKLYFDVNQNIKVVFVDAFGRFAFRKEDLLEINRLDNVDVYEIQREAVKDVTTEVNEVSQPKKKGRKNTENE